MNNKSIYIGDGVYASFDGYAVVLAVNHHDNKVVVIEPEVWANLVRFVDNLSELLAGGKEDD
jgi:hypothetical protein